MNDNTVAISKETNTNVYYKNNGREKDARTGQDISKIRRWHNLQSQLHHYTTFKHEQYSLYQQEMGKTAIFVKHGVKEEDYRYRKSWKQKKG